MGAEGAVDVLYGKELKAETDPERRAAIAEARKKEYNELFCNPWQAAHKGYIEDIIEPRNTRFRVIRALEALKGKRQEMPAKKHDNLPL
jgi:acetyl-CoA carboxylase carboxyltransferase component